MKHNNNYRYINTYPQNRQDWVFWVFDLSFSGYSNLGSKAAIPARRREAACAFRCSYSNRFVASSSCFGIILDRWRSFTKRLMSARSEKKTSVEWSWMALFG